MPSLSFEALRLAAAFAGSSDVSTLRCSRIFPDPVFRYWFAGASFELNTLSVHTMSSFYDVATGWLLPTVKPICGNIAKTSYSSRHKAARAPAGWLRAARKALKDLWGQHAKKPNLYR